MLGVLLLLFFHHDRYPTGKCGNRDALQLDADVAPLSFFALIAMPVIKVKVKVNVDLYSA